MANGARQSGKESKGVYIFTCGLKPFDSLKIFQLQEFSWVRHDCLLHPPFTKGVFCFWKAIRLAKRLALPEMLLGGTTKKHLLETPPNIMPSPRISFKTYQQKTMAHRWRSVVQGLIAHHHMQRWRDWGVVVQLWWLKGAVTTNDQSNDGLFLEQKWYAAHWRSWKWFYI